MLTRLIPRLGLRGASVAGYLFLVWLLLLVAGIWWWLPTYPRTSLSLPTEPINIRLSPDGKTLAAAHAFGLSLWDTESGKQKAMLELPAEPGVIQRGVAVEAVSPDGLNVLFRDEGGKLLRFWNSTSGAAPLTIDQEGGAICVSADGNLVAKFQGLLHMGGEASPMGNLATGKPRSSPLLKSRPMRPIMALQDGRLLGIDETDAPLCTIWELLTETRLLTLVDATQVSCSANGQRCVSISTDVIEVWDLSSGELVSAIEPNPRIDERILGDQSPDGRRLVIWEKPERICVLWDVTCMPARRIGSLTGANPYMHRFSPDSRRLAVTLPCEMGQKWEVWGTEPLLPHFRVDNAYFGPEFAPDSRTFVTEGSAASRQSWLDRILNRTYSGRYDITLWDVATGKDLKVFSSCEDFAYFPGGKQIAIACGDCTVEIWDVPPYRPIIIEWGLPALFVMLGLMGVWNFFRFRRQPSESFE